MTIDRLKVVVGLQLGPTVVHIGRAHLFDEDAALVPIERDHESTFRVSAQRHFKP